MTYLVSGHPPAYVLQFCVKSSLCIVTIYKAPCLLTEHNNKLCNVLAFVVYVSCNKEIMKNTARPHHRKRQSVTRSNCKFSTNSGLIIYSLFTLLFYSLFYSYYSSSSYVYSSYFSFISSSASSSFSSSSSSSQGQLKTYKPQWVWSVMSSTRDDIGSEYLISEEVRTYVGSGTTTMLRYECI